MLELEVPCNHCNGLGKVKHDWRDWMVDCDNCEGRGKVPSELGLQILEFVGHYLQSKDSDVLINKRNLW